MLIDDDDLILNSFSMTFNSKGCLLLTIRSAEAGLRVLYGTNIDIVICDYRLPGMNGINFFRQIKESHPHLKKILITSNDDNILLMQASMLGIHEIIKKPFSFDAILESLE